ISQPSNGKMILAVSQPVLDYTGRFNWMNDGGEGWDLTSDTLRLSTVRFDIKASTDDQYHVSLKKYSFGETEEEAFDRANKIQYTVYSRDSVLDLGNGYAIGKENKFRGQQVVIDIQVPVGKKIRFDESVNDKLNAVNVKVKRSYRRKRIVDIEINESRTNRYRPGVDYIMGANGELKGPDGTQVNNPTENNYRYQNIDSGKIKNPAKNETREEKKKRLEEELKKIIDEEKSGTFINGNREAGELNSSTGNPSPVFSLLHI
ncbi:MAG: hypothetical protein ACRDEB_05705, partial [Chitinophagaceae bacterium]